MAVLEKRKPRPQGRVMPARRTPEHGRQAVRSLVALMRHVVADQYPVIRKAELWVAADVQQAAGSKVMAGKLDNRLAVAKIAEVLCRSSARATTLVHSIKARREIRRALEAALPALEQDAPDNVRLGLAEVRVRLHRMGQAYE